MTITGDSQQRLDAYLHRLRTCLRGFKDDQVRDIVEELRSHVVDKVSAAGAIAPDGVEAALAALGSPEELASQYVTDNLLARAEVSRSPVQILRSLFRWASLSIAGFFVLLGAVGGYFAGAVFILVAVAKLFHPHTAGLWVLQNGGDDLSISFRLGFGSAPIGGKDLLGWWIVPIGWMGGCGLVMLTTHIAIWFVRKYRRSRLPPQS
jgi:hypothetical protein